MPFRPQRPRYARASAMLLALAAAAPALAVECEPPEPPPLTGTLAVALKQAGALAIIDAQSGTVLRTVDLAPDAQPADEGESPDPDRAGVVPQVGPHEVAISPDGTRAVVSLYGWSRPGNELVFLAMPEGRITGRVTLTGYTRPHGLAFVGAGDDQTLLVTAEAEDRLLVVDPWTMQVTKAIPTRQPGSHMVAASPCGTRAFVSNVGVGSVTVIDLAAAEPVKVVMTAPGAEGIAVRPGDGEHAGDIWVANNQSHTVSVIDADTLEVKKSVVTGAVPIRVAFTPDGTRALVPCVGTGELIVYDANAVTELGRVILESPEHYDAVHPTLGTSSVPIGVTGTADGRHAFVSSMLGNFISVVDLGDLEVRTVIPVDPKSGPDGIAWTPLTME